MLTSSNHHRFWISQRQVTHFDVFLWLDNRFLDSTIVLGCISTTFEDEAHVVWDVDYDDYDDSDDYERDDDGFDCVCCVRHLCW